MDASRNFEADTMGDGIVSPLPWVNIPERERIVWDDEDLNASLFRGLADAADGNVRRLDELTEDDPAE